MWLLAACATSWLWGPLVFTIVGWAWQHIASLFYRSKET